MIERAVGWLDTGGRAVLRGSKKNFRSRRHLHSAFWSHGAGNIDLPPWWMLFLQSSGLVQERRLSQRDDTPAAALSQGLQEIFLDFLYPVKTLSLIRRLKLSTTAQKYAARNIKLCSRSYTSVAADFVNGAKAVGATTRAFSQDASTTSSSEDPQPGDVIRRGINEMLNSKDHTWIYDELWQSYQSLLEMSQSLSPQELIKILRCLGTSKRTVDVERALALFESIPIQQRRAIHYSYAVSAALSLEDLDTAVDIHREALARISGSIGTTAVLRYTVQHEKWQLAIDTWHPYWVNRLRYYTRPDIWIGVNALSVPDLMEKANSAAEFAISTAESSQDENAVAARDFATELMRQVLGNQNTNFDIHKHWRLVREKARALDSLDMETQKMALKQLLSGKTRGHGHSALNLYRILRKEPTFVPSTQLLALVTRKLIAEKSSLGMSMMIEDWSTYHQGIPAGIAIDVARIFALLGELEPLHQIFQTFRFKTRRLEKSKGTWYHIFLFAHNRRADPKGVVRTFNELQKKFDIEPNVTAWNYVVGTFSRIGDVEGALSWFNKLLESKQQPDSRTYSLLMFMYANRGDWETVYDFYQQAKINGVKTDMMMINSIVLATVKDERLADAEQLVKEALHVDLEGSRTAMWTILLNAYALRGDVEKVSELHKQMQASEVPNNGMTYAALMTSLIFAKMHRAAYKILHVVMPRAQIKRTALHYAIVMGGYLGLQNYAKIFSLSQKLLLRNLSPTMSTQNIFLRAAALADKAETASPDSDSDKGPDTQTEHVRAQQTFDQIMSNLDPMELAASEPRKFVGPDPLNEAFSSNYFEYLISLYGKDGAFDKVTDLYERYISTSARFSNRDVEASPPIRLLSALMVAHTRAGDHEELERCWYLALDKSEKLACRATADRSEPGWVLHSRRLIMNVPLRYYITSLGKQGHIRDLISTIQQLHSSGFALNNPNWNLYIQQLAQSSEPDHQLLAFELCERELIPEWPGWDTLGDPTYVKNKIRQMTSRTLLLPNRRAPFYLTLVHLAAVYLQAKQGIRLTKPLQFIGVAPKTVDALINMPRMADKHQISLLRGG